MPLITFLIDSPAAIIHEASDPTHRRSFALLAGTPIARAADEGALVFADRRVCGSGAGHIPLWREWLSGCTVGVHARMQHEHARRGHSVYTYFSGLDVRTSGCMQPQNALQGWRFLYSPVYPLFPVRMAKSPAARDATGPVLALHLTVIRWSRYCHTFVLLNQPRSLTTVLGIHKTLQAIIGPTHTTNSATRLDTIPPAPGPPAIRCM
ncbi:hypothetical protein B0H19DRAFT_1085025 [Mycena capillaripes]|nr:hypothetical protein B0H19DRAFT_1085025 [Mycena capillaripes]